MKYRRRRLRRSIIRVASVCILLVLLPEVGLRLLAAKVTSNVSSPDDFPANPPPAYANAPYWNPDFFKEFRHVYHSYIYLDDGLVNTPDFSGAYFNVHNNRRATTNQPTSAEHTIW